MQTDLTKFKIEIKKEYDAVQDELSRLSNLLEKIETLREELRTKESILESIKAYETRHGEKSVSDLSDEFSTSTVAGYVRSLFLKNPTQDWFLKELMVSVQNEIDAGRIKSAKESSRGLLDTIVRRLVNDGFIQKFKVDKTPYFRKGT